MKAFEDMTIEEISSNKILLEKYQKELNVIRKTYFGRKVTDDYRRLTISEIEQKIYELEEEHRSYDLFPQDIVLIYSKLQEVKAKRTIICDFSGSRIFPGSLYINYRPMIKNISRNETYVLKRSLKVETGYCYDLPENIQELEALNREMQFGEHKNGIDYSHLSQQQGGSLQLIKLKEK